MLTKWLSTLGIVARKTDLPIFSRLVEIFPLIRLAPHLAEIILKTFQPWGKNLDGCTGLFNLKTYTRWDHGQKKLKGNRYLSEFPNLILFWFYVGWRTPACLIPSELLQIEAVNQIPETDWRGGLAQTPTKIREKLKQIGLNAAALHTTKMHLKIFFLFFSKIVYQAWDRYMNNVIYTGWNEIVVFSRWVSLMLLRDFD